jgi:hypothetical protein
MNVTGVTGRIEHDFARGGKPSLWSGNPLAPIWGTTRPQHAVLIVVAAGIPLSRIASGRNVTLWLVIGLVLVAAGAALNLVPYTGAANMAGAEKPKLADWLALQLRWRHRPPRYTSDGPTAGVNAATGQAEYVTPPPEIGNIDWLRHKKADDTEVGVVTHRSTGRTLAWVEVVPPPTGLSEPDAVDLVAAALNRMHHEFANGGFADMIVQRTSSDPAGSRPTHPWDLLDSAPDTPAVLDTAHKRQTAALADHPVFRSWWAVVIPDNKTVDAAIKRKGGGDEGLVAIALEELAALSAALVSAGYTVLGELDLAALVSMTRATYDRSVTILAPQSGQQLDQRYAWPIKRDASHPAYIWADGCLTSVWEVGMPWLPKPARFDAGLMTGQGDVPRTFVLLKRLTPTDEALEHAESDSVVAAAVQEHADQHGEDHGARARMQTATAQRRTQTLAQGDVGVTIVQYLITNATDEDTLHDNERRLSRAAVATGRDLKILWKDMPRGVTVGCPFGQGLR